MAKVVVLGAGFSGQTAALYLRKKLNKQHEVIVIGCYYCNASCCTRLREIPRVW